MKIEIIFDPTLAVDCKEFVAEWRADAVSRAIGEMSVASAGTRRTMGDPVTVAAVLTGIAQGVAPNAIWDAIKAACGRLRAAKNEQSREIEFQHVRRPDGTEITIVRLRE